MVPTLMTASWVSMSTAQPRILTTPRYLGSNAWGGVCALIVLMETAACALSRISASWAGVPFPVYCRTHLVQLMLTR